MLHLTCTTITSVDLAHYGVSRAKDLGICGLWHKILLTTRSRSTFYRDVTKGNYMLCIIMFIPLE